MLKAQLPVPIEIIEVIIDHLHDNKKSLQACSLVAREWLPTSRFHLIPSLVMHHENYTQLLQLLETPCCRLVPSVRVLKLVNLTDTAQNVWINDALPALAKHFSSITFFSISRIYWRQITPQTFSCLIDAFPNVDTLEMIDCVFQEFKQHAELMCSFKAAKTIKTFKCHYEVNVEGQYPHSTFQLSPFIRKIIVDGLHPVVMTWLEEQNSLLLEHLSTGPLYFENLNIAGRIISRSGPRLRSLHFGFGYNFRLTESDRPRLDLNQNTSLEELELSLACSPAHIPFFSGLETGNSSFILSLFSSISSQKLQKLKLRILVHSAQRLTEIDWDALDNLPTQKVWGESLKHFLIELFDISSSNVTPESFMEEAEGIIYAGLPQLAKRGLLDVKYLPIPNGRGPSS